MSKGIIRPVEVILDLLSKSHIDFNFGNYQDKDEPVWIEIILKRDMDGDDRTSLNISFDRDELIDKIEIWETQYGKHVKDQDMLYTTKEGK